MTTLKRLEKTWAVTLGNFIAMLCTLDLLDVLKTLIPDASAPGPLELLEADRKNNKRKRALRALNDAAIPVTFR